MIEHVIQFHNMETSNHGHQAVTMEHQPGADSIRMIMNEPNEMRAVV